MIELERSMATKWIFQKNINDKKLIESYIDALKQTDEIDKKNLMKELRKTDAYRGRKRDENNNRVIGALSTIGVRFSQMCFYMFGYKVSKNVGRRTARHQFATGNVKKDIFMPSPTTLHMLNIKEDLQKCMLINLFSIQFPHPYSNTSDLNQIYAGRLIIKLLLDNKINYRIYIDEFIYFLPFIKTINQSKYNELVNSILEFRSKSYEEKLKLFKGVKDWEHLFANTVHECSYFFARIFNQFRIFDLTGDSSHNDGLLFKFRHGGRRSSVFRESAQDHNTFRNDAYESGAKYSGYISLNKEIIDDCKKLLNKFNVFDKPENGIGIPPEEWIYNLYDRDMMNYLAVIMPQKTAEAKIINDINTMQLSAVQGNVEGTDFENSLKPVFELFRENIKVDVISGAGNPDLICIFVNNSNNYKVNIEAKSRNSFNNLNLLEPQRHSIQHNTKYAIVVAPRFTPRTIAELTQVQQDHNVVLLNSDTLGRYCQKECLSSDDGLADYNSIDDIIINNKCSDISPLVDDLIIDRYGT